jgi:predicted dehydrogenase
MKKIIAIIGTGNASETHINCYNKMKNMDIKWIFSKKIDRARDLSKKYNIPNYTQNYKDILNDSEVEIIDIINTNHQHLNFAEKALKKGKNIIIEKPIDINIKKAKRFYEKYKDSDKSILIVYQYPYSETFKKLSEVIHSKQYGDLKAYKIKYFSFRNNDYYNKKWTSSPSTAGGGVLINQGIHFINLMYGFIGYSDMSIFASKQNVTHKMEVEDTIFIQTTHKNGIIGSFSFSSGLPSEMYIELLFKNTIVWTKGDQVIIKGTENKIIPTPQKGDFKDIINEYLINLKKKPNYKMNFKEAIMDLDIVLSSYLSAKKKKIIKFETLK